METNEHGFTLIELLLVLSVIAVLSVLVLPSMVQMVHNIQTNQFFKKMDSDVLLVQNRSLEQTGDYVRIIFNEDHYIIYQASKLIKKQAYPKNMSFKHESYTIYFGSSGTVKNAGTFKLQDDNDTYQITFPLGKGRQYVEREQ